MGKLFLGIRTSKLIIAKDIEVFNLQIKFQHFYLLTI